VYSSPVYSEVLKRHGQECVIPDEAVRERLNAAIFDEPCQGIFNAQTTELFIRAIDDLQSRGAECVVLGCTEIPLIITSDNSPLPVLDSTRLLARDAVREEAYKQLFAAKSRLNPCFNKIFSEKKLSQETKDIIREETMTLADSLDRNKSLH